MAARKSIKIVKSDAEIKLEEFLKDYVQLYPETLKDGKKYMLGVSLKDKRWYKQKELYTFQVDPKNNSPFRSVFDNPVILSAEDIKYLDKPKK